MEENTSENFLLRHVTQDFDFKNLTHSTDPKIRALGTRIEKAFKDPIQEIK